MFYAENIISLKKNYPIKKKVFEDYFIFLKSISIKINISIEKKLIFSNTVILWVYE